MLSSFRPHMSSRAPASPRLPGRAPCVDSASAMPPNHASRRSSYISMKSRILNPLQAARFRIEYWIFLVYLKLIQALPLEFAIRWTGLAFQYFPRWSARHLRADQNLSNAYPTMNLASRKRLLGRMWRSYGMTFAETFLIDRIAAQPDRIELDEDALEALRLADEAGAVFVCPHLGNWEISVVPVARRATRHAAVYTRIKNPLFEARIFDVRSKYYSGGLHPRGPAAAKALSRHLRGGGSVGVMADLRDDHYDCMTPFFGRYAPSTVFPATLARHYQRPLIADCLIRTGPGRFKMKIETIPVPRTVDRSADIYAATAAVQACFERWIRKDPEQWLWTHRRYYRDDRAPALIKAG